MNHLAWIDFVKDASVCKKDIHYTEFRNTLIECSLQRSDVHRVAVLEYAAITKLARNLL